MRITPRPLPAVLAYLGYLLIFYGVWVINGIDYPRIGESAETALKWYVEPLAGGAVFLIIIVSVFGWWAPALREVARATPTWLWVSPILMAVLAVAGLVGGGYGGRTAQFVALVLLGSILVGFCEELITRGVLVVGFRATWTEPMVWLGSTLLFALLHLPNWVFGAGPGAVAQVVLAFLSGTALYLARRVSGLLVMPMFIHGLWDFAGFLPSTPANWVVLSALLNSVVALGCVIVLLRRERGIRTPQVGVPALS
ncbi:MAG: CPBP family glutamic-type intramembrane protease [Candidatus Nanopelagicales bacterium]